MLSFYNAVRRPVAGVLAAVLIIQAVLGVLADGPPLAESLLLGASVSSLMLLTVLRTNESWERTWWWIEMLAFLVAGIVISLWSSATGSSLGSLLSLAVMVVLVWEPYCRSRCGFGPSARSRC